MITGISVGILVTFIIHVVINKSLSLFVSHLVKPNILLFKEKGEGNYYVSVKHFCSFLNFYKLKNKLDVIPEHEDVVLDFSMCSFVDDTVMEGLDNYADTFSKKGGSIEIIGLDKHETDSKHPFAIRKIIPLTALNSIERYFTKRQNDLKSTAKDYHWKYIANKNTSTDFLRDFVFFRTRNISFFYNHLSDKNKNCSVFDVEFTEGAFIAKEVIKTSVMYIKLETEIPVFTLDREGLLKFIYSLAGFRDIDFEDHPDFSKRFYLSGPDDLALRSFFYR